MSPYACVSLDNIGLFFYGIYNLLKLVDIFQEQEDNKIIASDGLGTKIYPFYGFYVFDNFLGF